MDNEEFLDYAGTAWELNQAAELGGFRCVCGARFPARWLREDHWNTADDGQAHGVPVPDTDDSDTQLTDAQALAGIQEMLRDPEWGVGMLEDIADIVRATGRTVEDYEDGRSTWDRH